MNQGAEVRTRFERIIEANQYMTLATADADGLPWASPVWYAASGDEFVWASDPTARHSRNLAVRPQLAIAIFDSHQAPGTGTGIYIAAHAEPVADEQLDRAIKIFSDKLAARSGETWTRSDVNPPSRLRLYRAMANERYVLSTGKDVRIPVPSEV
jgi:nitroimidazol reductase NimA-like FMN-containing flavoprotein (pyridoxamine 5'-phosphate oxidase superfamily)